MITYAWPELAGVKFRGINLVPRLTDTGNGDYGVPACFYDTLYDWGVEGPTSTAWTQWLKPQIDAMYAHGCNLVRMMFCATLRQGDSGHHGAATWRGTITADQQAAMFDQMARYLAGKGMWFYPTATESTPVGDAGLTLTQINNFLSEFVAMATSTSYTNVAAIDLIQEWDARGGTTVTGNVSTIVANAQASRVKAIPLTMSLNGAASSGDLNPGSRGAFGTLHSAGVDFFDVHVYYKAPIADYASLFSQLATWGQAAVIGETGINYNGNFTSGAADGSSATKRLQFYQNLGDVAQDYRLQAVQCWAAVREWTTDGNDWGLFGSTQDGSYVFADPRTPQLTEYERFPLTVQARDSGVDPGPEVGVPTVGTITSGAASLSWSAADGGTGTRTYTPQAVKVDTNGFATGSWSASPSTTSTSGKADALDQNTRYAVRLKVTDTATPVVTNYSPWVYVTTAAATLGWRTM